MGVGGAATQGDGDYRDERAHALRARYVETFGGREIPVPVESIAEDLLGLRVERSYELGECSGMLLPAEKLILVNAYEEPRSTGPMRRWRFTVAHELGHWVCHATSAAEPARATYCRAEDMTGATDRRLEREANIFAAELLMPEPAVREAWERYSDVDACAAHFDVSPSAMHWRLFNFTLVDEAPA